jgi:hypothetical protein
LLRLLCRGRRRDGHGSGRGENAAQKEESHGFPCTDADPAKSDKSRALSKGNWNCAGIFPGLYSRRAAAIADLDGIFTGDAGKSTFDSDLV